MGLKRKQIVVLEAHVRAFLAIPTITHYATTKGVVLFC